MQFTALTITFAAVATLILLLFITVALAIITTVLECIFQSKLAIFLLVATLSCIFISSQIPDFSETAGAFCILLILKVLEEITS